MDKEDSRRNGFWHSILSAFFIAFFGYATKSFSIETCFYIFVCLAIVFLLLSFLLIIPAREKHRKQKQNKLFKIKEKSNKGQPREKKR